MTTLDLTPYVTPEQIAHAVAGEVCSLCRGKGEIDCGVVLNDCPTCHEGRRHRLTFDVPLAEQPPAGVEFELTNEDGIWFRKLNGEGFVVCQPPIPIGEYAVAEEWLWNAEHPPRLVSLASCDMPGGVAVLVRDGDTLQLPSTMPAELAPRCNVLRNMSATGVQVECACFHGIVDWATPRERFCTRCNRTGQLWRVRYSADLEVRDAD